MARARKQPRKPLCLEAVPPIGEIKIINGLRKFIKPSTLKLIIVSFSGNDAIWVLQYVCPNHLLLTQLTEFLLFDSLTPFSV